MDERPSYDDRLLHILKASAGVFAEKGYDRASIRDIASATGVSLSGLYYYFRSKEELLFLIQDHCFGTLLSRLEQDLDGVTDPESRLRILVGNHLRFFVNNMKEMKVLSHEAGALSGRHRSDVGLQKRRYVSALSEILDELRPTDEPHLRTATFALFGMMNWIYTWYREGQDLAVRDLEREIVHIFLNGFRASRVPEPTTGISDGSAPAGRALVERASIWRSR